jgi:hydrophobic/amphiphilic exporter-1 (mainly G- bacteria), HAE1 family
VIGGLLVSTLLTLVVIPVVYNLLDRKSDEAFARESRALDFDGSAGEPA